MSSRLKWLTLTAVAAVAWGCSAPAPQRSPGPGVAPPVTDRTPGSTTGDVDACAYALGNVGTTAAPAPAGTDLTSRTEATANGVMVGNVALVALPSADDMPVTPGTATPPTGPTSGTGITPPATTPAPNGAAPNLTAADRIRNACPKVVQIRVVSDPNDRARLAQIASAIRRNEPITDYLEDISRMSKRAVVYPGSPNATTTGTAPTQ